MALAAAMRLRMTAPPPTFLGTLLLTFLAIQTSHQCRSSPTGRRFVDFFCFPTHSHCIVHLFFAHLLTFPKILATQVDSSALKSGTKRHDARA
jgi:hypothetical protein